MLKQSSCSATDGPSDTRFARLRGAASPPSTLTLVEFIPMETTKQRAIQALSTLPDDATIDDAIDQLCFLAKVDKGLRDSDSRAAELS